MLTETSQNARKAAMKEALTNNFGIVTAAAKSIGIARDSHYDWMKNDPEYAAWYLSLGEYKKDFIESKLINLVNTGDTAATIFAAKTQLRDRGYQEHVKAEVVNKILVQVERTNHQTTTIDITHQSAEGLGLPQEVQRAMLREEMGEDEAG